MKYTRVLCAIGVTIWSALAAGNQAKSVSALPPALRAHVKDARFLMVTSVRGLPLGVRGELQKLFGSDGLDIAEIGAPFQSTDAAVTPPLPIRRMAAAACSYDYCLVYYERGGGPRTWHVAIFHWTPAATRFEWGGIAPAGLKTIDAVRSAILSGLITDAKGPW